MSRIYCQGRDLAGWRQEFGFPEEWEVMDCFQPYDVTPPVEGFDETLKTWRGHGAARTRIQVFRAPCGEVVCFAQYKEASPGETRYLIEAWRVVSYRPIIRWEEVTSPTRYMWPVEDEDSPNE